MYRSTYFGRLHAHHHELTTALTASGFTVGALVVVVRLVIGRGLVQVLFLSLVVDF